jgi:uncharacterized protein (TIGR00730 family)
MSDIESICVYCGSSPGSDPAFVEAAEKLGEILAANRIRLVYGGGSIGLMGALAKSVLTHGGELTGVIPEFLASRERMLTSAHELVVTRDMHERKRVMFERADAFVALPGGVGTLEELIEQMTWAQLGRHKKPIVICNTRAFWTPLLDLLAHMERVGFIHSSHLFSYHTAEQVEDILPTLRAAMPRFEAAVAAAGDVDTIKRM